MAKTTVDTDRSESAVRQYLTFLKSPESLVDATIADSLRKRLNAETDPVEQLKIHTAIEHAEKVDEDGITRDFIIHAKEYATREGVTATAFIHMGVPKTVLKEAGLLMNIPAAKRDAAPSGKKRTRVGQEQIIAAAKAFEDSPFTIKELEQVSGASPVSVRKAIDEMIVGGSLTETEPDPAHSGRGRAPKRFLNA